METGIKSSFIPQAPITPARTAARRGGGFDFFTILSIVVLVASATLAAAVFLYAQYLATSSASKLDQLNRAKAAFEPALIQDLTRLDDRMRAADRILGTHVAPTTLFHLLEQLTLQTVSFGSLSFTTAETIELSMQGLAESVNSIALQADYLSKSGIITNPIFSNINRQIGGVRFDFTAEVNPTALRYSAAQGGAQPAQQTQEPEAPPSPFGTPDGAEPAGTGAPTGQPTN